VTGAGLEVELEIVGLLFVRKGDIGNERPGGVLGCLRGFAGIVLGDAPLQIGGYADLAAEITALAFDEVDVMHGRIVHRGIAKINAVAGSPAPPRLRRASCFAIEGFDPA
jgi:hypothetical protein